MSQIFQDLDYKYKTGNHSFMSEYCLSIISKTKKTKNKTKQNKTKTNTKPFQSEPTGKSFDASLCHWIHTYTAINRN